MSRGDIEFDIKPMGAVRYNPASKFRDDWKRYQKYKNDLAVLAKQAGYEVSVPLSITFVMPVSASWSKKEKAASIGQPHTFKPDLDNFIKGFKDALMEDDAAVWKYGEMQKLWGETGKIIVHQLTEPQ